MDIRELKRSQLEDVAAYREKLRIEPRLNWLFFEITNRCNLKCKHCGSSCTASGEELSVDDVKNTLKTIHAPLPMVCLTGGEPMLHPDFFEIAECVRALGFRFGITSNATLIDDVTALKLRDVGMSTISVSLDGFEESHDNLRQQKGAWKRAVRGLDALKKAGFYPQVTTVIHRENFGELEAFYEFLCEIGITDWRVINVEPIGRACESSDFMLSSEQLAQLIGFIKSKRFDDKCDMHVTFGCSHYLGVDEERMVRDHYFLCAAGIITASVRSNGDICACLDIENRPELIQGNIRRDNFFEVWQHSFKPFRRDRTADSEKCTFCPERFICGGDSAHTWNFGKNEPLLCYRDFKDELSKIKT